jgi:hypothetical protein
MVLENIISNSDNKKKIYLKEYYQNNKDEINRKAREKWHNNHSSAIKTKAYRKEKRDNNKEVINKQIKERRDKRSNEEKDRERLMSYNRRHSFLGKLQVAYHALVVRSKKHGFTEIVNQEDFLEFGKNNDQYIELFNQWINSGRQRKYSPSVDRIDFTKPYVLGNIQFLTTGENTRKGVIEHNRAKKVKATKDGEVFYFTTLSDFERFTGRKGGSLSTNTIKNSKTIFGYKLELI